MGTPFPLPRTGGREIVETLGFYPWEAAGSLQRPGPVLGSPGRPPRHLHSPPKAARAQGRSGSPVQAVRAIHTGLAQPSEQVG